MNLEECFVQLRNDIAGVNLLRGTVLEYYASDSTRIVEYFLETDDEEWGWHYQHFLVDRRHIFRYGIGQDRGVWLGGLDLAIGPHYFGVAQFWDYANSERFKLDATTEAVKHNLALLDEFLRKTS